MIPIRHAAAAAVALAFVSVIALAPAASGHTEVLRASPGPAETVTGVIDRVELTFLDPVLDGVTITVAGPGGGPVDGLAPAELGAENRSALATFDPLTTDGGYVVEYAFAAADGDRQRETYRFTYRGAPTANTPDTGLRTGSVLGAVAVLLTVLAAIVVARQRRHAE